MTPYCAFAQQQQQQILTRVKNCYCLYGYEEKTCKWPSSVLDSNSVLSVLYIYLCIRGRKMRTLVERRGVSAAALFARRGFSASLFYSDHS